jgi:branched-chain amino acid transport system ATP-binding protein
LRPEERTAAGIGWVPQERGIFRTLSVEENLSAVARPGPWNASRVFALFPRLAERRKSYGATLSGGEQQMLAVGRALVLNPKVILLDEPLEGLAPMIVAELLAAISRILREERTAAIVVEQHARLVLGMTDHAIILDRGRIVRSAPSAELLADDSALDAHLGVTSRRTTRG